MDTDPRPLHGRRVVLTRSESDNRSLAKALSGSGAVALPLPLVEVLPPDDGGRALAAAVEELARYRWVVLTSVNGVSALRSVLNGRPWPDGSVVAPVGPATAAAARAAGMIVAPPPATATAESVVDTFPPWDGIDGRRILAPLAELAGGTIVDGLTAKGYEVDRVTAYRTAAPIGGGRQTPGAAVSAADALTFFSPSVVDRFADRFDPRTAPSVVVCIGPTTARRAIERGFGGVVMADPHTESGVIDALCEALGHDR